MRYKILKYRKGENLYGIIQNQTVCVQHLPVLMSESTTIEQETKYIDPNIPEPFADFDLLTVEMVIVGTETQKLNQLT